jgi:hypothetical protein
MLGLLKKMFGVKPADPVAVPYKVETPPVEPAQTPVVEEVVAPVKAARKPKASPAVKKVAVPKAPRKPKTP